MTDEEKKLVAELANLLEHNAHHWEEERCRSTCNDCGFQCPKHREGCRIKAVLDEAKKLIAG